MKLYYAQNVLDSAIDDVLLAVSDLFVKDKLESFSLFLSLSLSQKRVLAP